MLADKSHKGSIGRDPSLHGTLMPQPSGMSITSQQGEAQRGSVAHRMTESVMPLLAATATRFSIVAKPKGEIAFIWVMDGMWPAGPPKSYMLINMLCTFKQQVALGLC